MENIIAFPKETQEKVVEHQKWLLKNGMKRAAVVNNSATAKMQLERTAKESEHKNAFHFSSFEEALKFLQGP